MRIEQKAGKVFEGWEEGEIKFAPTYKYSTNSDNYVCQIPSMPKHQRRTPAWWVTLQNYIYIIIITIYNFAIRFNNSFRIMEIYYQFRHLTTFYTYVYRCDRILWKGEGLKQMCYGRINESRFSDHRPVYSVFSIQVNYLTTNHISLIPSETVISSRKWGIFEFLRKCFGRMQCFRNQISAK